MKQETKPQDTSTPKDELNFDFIQSALNSYWYDAHSTLEKKGLGDLEKIELEKIKTIAQKQIRILENMPTSYNYLAMEELYKALEEVTSDLFYQIESKSSSLKAYQYPSIMKAKTALQNAKI